MSDTLIYLYTDKVKMVIITIINYKYLNTLNKVNCIYSDLIFKNVIPKFYYICKIFVYIKNKD